MNAWKPYQCFENNKPNYWIVSDKAWRGNVLAKCESLEQASTVAKAVNQHAALLAVAEAAKNLTNCHVIDDLEVFNLSAKLDKALATLAQIQKGE